jgi:type II secretory ATPase GspE/PulE/Tfp pilus assembly ATPase PilB-like protein
MMDYNEDLKQMLIEGKGAIEVERLALQKWMINLERDGIFKVIKGHISLKSVYELVKHKEPKIIPQA